MYSKVNYTLIGFFVLSFVVALVAFAFWLGNKGVQENYSLYLLRMKESVTGLSKDSGIKMKGVDIGSISTITINPQNIEEVDIVLKIKNNIPIKEDMLGVIKMYGLTGLSYVEIAGGTNNSKLLVAKSPDTLPQIQAGISLLSKLENNLDTLSTKLISILDRGEKLLSNKNLQSFENILVNIDKVSAKTLELEEQSIATLLEAEEGIKEFRVTMKSVSEEFHTLSSNITSNLHDLEPTITAVKKMSKSVDQMVITFEKSVNRGDYNMQKVMTPMMIDIRELSTQMEEMVLQLDQSPNDILFKSTKPKRGPGE